MNNQKDKFPRTLEEAFGPGERGPIVDPKHGQKEGRIVTFAIVAIFVLLAIGLWL